MKLILVAALTVSAAFAAVPNCGQTPIPPNIDSARIVNGEDAVPYSFPWQVALCLKSVVNGLEVPDCRINCGGSVINENHVITAGHCAVSTTNSPYQLKVGVFNIRDTNEEGVVIAEVEEQIRTPNYDDQKLENDITILRLAQPLTFSDRIQPVCLATSEDALVGSDESSTGSGTTLYTTGWGRLSGFGSIPPKLQQVAVEYRSRDYCRRNDKINVFGDTKICVGGKSDGKGACNGDSGGPLVGRNDDGTFTLYGVTSYKSTGQQACVGTNSPTGYARVSVLCDFINDAAGAQVCG